MDAVLHFLFRDHTVGLVALALFVCAVSAYACIRLARHAHKAPRKRRLRWIIVAGGSVGFGIWTTHFVAMLGYDSGLDIGYDVALTALSLVIAIVLSTVGLAVAVAAARWSDIVLGGALVGLGISAMHFTGIASMVVGGRPAWSAGLVLVSVLAGIVLGGASFALGLGGGRWRTFGGAALMTAAVGTMHFTAMAAIDLSMCFSVVPPMSGTEVTVSVASAIFGIGLLVLALATMRFDRLDRHRRDQELARRRLEKQRLSDAHRRLEVAIDNLGQGIGLYGPDGRLVVHNKRLPQMVGLADRHDITGLTRAEISRESIARSISDPATVEREVQALDSLHGALIGRPGGGEITHEVGDRTLRVSYVPVEDGSVVTMVDDITDRLRSEERIRYLSRHDALTGLPNRTEYFDSLRDVLRQAQRSGQVVAVLALDIDDLGEVNDRFGMVAGDRVIVTIAERMQGRMQPGEVVARTGGDEFGAFKTMPTAMGLETWVADLYRGIGAPMEVARTTLKPSARMGIAIFPQDGDDAAKLIANADLALARARQEAPGSICLYEPRFDEESRRRRDLLADIRDALETNQFTVAYQVQRSVTTDRVTGYEALVRWQHPVRGNVPPSTFIPVAEQAGLIVPLGYRVLETACREALAAGLEGRLAVNLSPLQLADPGLLVEVEAILKRTGFPAKRLWLEVTESAIFASKDTALQVLRGLKLLSISIAIDDFGTGYSSLETLRSFPFDKIKLDRSFVAEIEDSAQAQAIMRAVIGLGHALGMPVLAEGVETGEQLEALRREGCSEVQGYLLGRPKPISAYLPAALAS